MGDISLIIAAPSGKKVTLRNREGGAEDDLHTTF